MDEQSRAIKEAAQFARLDEQVTGIREDITGLRQDSADFRKEMRDMFGSIIQTYATKETLKAELALRDKEIGSLKHRVDDLEKVREKEIDNATHTANIRAGWGASMRVAVVGALVGAVGYGVVGMVVNAFSKH